LNGSANLLRLSVGGVGGARAIETLRGAVIELHMAQSGTK